MLIDEVLITVKAGKGGDGAVSFRREKHVPKGGPDGGDGAHGANVVIKASASTHGLASYRGAKIYKAEPGENGSGARSAGRSGEDLYLSVPPGTRIIEVRNNQELVVADLKDDGDEIVIARGGRGGKGNWHFRGPQNQTPRQFEPGTPGEQKTIKLELQLIADVGLVGLPNAGKSTLLSVISNARPKIADYPFTTLEPNLGMVHHAGNQFVVADIPGLIEGAAGGKGLGHEFLKHILRTNVIVHLVSVLEDNLEAVYQTIRNELGQFDKTLLDKPEIVVLTKIDALPEYEEFHGDFINQHKPLAISAVTHQGTDILLYKIAENLPQAVEPVAEDSEI